MAQHSPTASYETNVAPELGKLRLRELREAAGVSQYVLADMLGIPRSTYKDYEMTNRKTPYDILYRLSKHYNVTMEYILGYC